MKFNWFKVGLGIVFAPFLVGVIITGLIKMNGFLIEWSGVTDQGGNAFLAFILIVLQAVSIILCCVTAHDNRKKISGVPKGDIE